ncbi:purine/pyrimidine permease [Pragia fontium]|uniref:Xanthine/uracil permease n=1 Tax=Pragia fontium DSM 5563 = ATCC 49100 TaxID=1122977 RepID=A0AAJ5BGX6_9GAMM|nr:purine/pyrimidine permease [Pragia fontium]SFC68077.1 Xanthine/uracil permease [Pragia fontium DSM 5563 = ATCC 49100]VEJ56417.1 Putative purine permease ybbY [Pragia fontium]
MKFILASLQWMLYILMGSVVIPVSIASTFGLTPDAIIEFVSRTLFILGVAGILQALFGHKLPIIEGPAGIWWGVFALYAGIGSVLFGSHNETLRVMEFSFILSGCIFILLSLLGVVNKIAKLFTPTVMGVYLILLVVQLSGTFLKGMMGISKESTAINPTITLLSIATVAIAYICIKIKQISTYATLVSIISGWILFYLFGYANPITPVTSAIKLPAIFPFGTPRLEHGMIVNVFLLTILLLTNLMASVKVVQTVFQKFELPVEDRLNKTSIVSGIIHLLSGTFGAIGPVPISGSAAFIAQTRFTQLLPFICGNLLIILISLSPIVTSFFAALPPAVGYAALIPSFGLGIIMIALTQFDSVEDKGIRNHSVAAGWFVGISAMFLPATAFAGLSPLVTSLLSNGLILGTLVAVTLERLMLYRQKQQLSSQGRKSR